MNNYLFFLLLLTSTTGFAQDFRHELTDRKDSIKLNGLKLYFEIDSVYQVNDTSGIRFALEIINNGNEKLNITNPIYDTKVDMRIEIYNLITKQEIKLKEVSRWPNPKYAEGIKPYSLENVIASGQNIPKNQHVKYWETDTLSLEKNEKIRYEMNLYEHVLADQNNNPRIESLPKGEYYSIITTRIRTHDSSITMKPLRFMLRLE